MHAAVEGDHVLGLHEHWYRVKLPDLCGLHAPLAAMQYACEPEQ